MYLLSIYYKYYYESIQSIPIWPVFVHFGADRMKIENWIYN